MMTNARSLAWALIVLSLGAAAHGQSNKYLVAPGNVVVLASVRTNLHHHMTIDDAFRVLGGSEMPGLVSSSVKVCWQLADGNTLWLEFRMPKPNTLLSARVCTPKGGLVEEILSAEKVGMQTTRQQGGGTVR